MAVDPVPWAITGSQMDTFIMRELANFAVQDAEGIQLPGDCKVTASGANVAIAPGGVAVDNKQAAGQSYIGRVASSTLVPIPPNSSGATVSYLIVLTVKDPDFSPWQPWPAGTPSSTVLFGPYFYPERLAATTATTRAGQLVSYSSLALARVDMPAGATTVQPQYITDLRYLCRPRFGFAQSVFNGPATEDNLAVNQSGFRTFPNNATMGVTIPTWATHCVATVDIASIAGIGGGDFQGRVNIGGLVSTESSFDYNGGLQTVIPGAVEMIPWSVFGDIDVRSLQGQTVTCQVQARRTYPENTGIIRVGSYSQIKFDLRFVERTV